MPITCYDGSLAESYDQCPDIGTEWDIATGIGIDPETGTLGTGVSGDPDDPWVQPAWWDDPETLDEDEHAKYIYQLAGGQETTGMDFDTFWDKHGESFTTWETSGYGDKYENVLKQLGMLNTSIELASEGFNIKLDSLNLQRHAKVDTALSQKEDIGGQMESQFIGTGGVVSGRNIEKAKEASEDINQALGLEFRGINIERDLLQHAYKGELVGIEDRRIDYENELIGLEDSYEKHLIDLVNLMDIQKVDCPDGEVPCPDGTCAASESACLKHEDCPPGLILCNDGLCGTSCEGNNVLFEEGVESVEGIVEGQKEDWQILKDEFNNCKGSFKIGTPPEEGALSNCWEALKAGADALAIDPLELVEWAFPDLKGDYEWWEEGIRGEFEDLLGEEFVEDAVEYGKESMNNACIIASAPGCAPYATGKALWGGTWQGHYDDCIKNLCG